MFDGEGEQQKWAKKEEDGYKKPKETSVIAKTHINLRCDRSNNTQY